MSKEWMVCNHCSEVDEIKAHSERFLTLGILMTILGVLGISYSAVVTLASVVFIGFLLVASGVGHLIHTFWARQWKGIFVSLLLGILSIILGAICLVKPVQSAASITLIIGAFCLTVGIFRMVSTAFLHFERWGWVFTNGLITFILGLLILSQWPISGLWLIGLFVGIEVFLSGISLILLSVAIRK